MHARGIYYSEARTEKYVLSLPKRQQLEAVAMLLSKLPPPFCYFLSYAFSSYRAPTATETQWHTHLRRHLASGQGAGPAQVQQAARSSFLNFHLHYITICDAQARQDPPNPSTSRIRRITCSTAGSEQQTSMAGGKQGSESGWVSTLSRFHHDEPNIF